MQKEDGRMSVDTRRSSTADERSISDLLGLVFQMRRGPEGLRSAVTPLLIQRDFNISDRERLRQVLALADHIDAKLSAMQHVCQTAIDRTEKESDGNGNY